jgi:hypothetical protein
MKTLLVAIHGILTNQTDPSWPDKLDAWMFDHAPGVKVLKKKYFAGPFPRWNCWIKDPQLAHSLANELELFLKGQPLDPEPQPALWFVAHSNGAVIALLTARLLAQRGYRIAGLILTGAAVEADLAKNGMLELMGRGALGAIVAYCSHEDEVLDGDPAHSTSEGRPSALACIRQHLWGRLMGPYGCLGRTGLLLDGEPLIGLGHESCGLRRISTRWFPGGHSTYFSSWNIETTFRQILDEITATTIKRTKPNEPPSDSFRGARRN